MKVTNQYLKEGIILRILGIFLLLFCNSYLGMRMVERVRHNASLSTYQQQLTTLEKEDYQELKKAAKLYNDVLFQSQGMYIAGMTDTYLSYDKYMEMLKVKGTEVMARIDIPKINVKLPIYHGTSDEVLANGIGHLQTSSLPIGGENTRAILSGHRGQVEAAMFTRLDELEKGDLIFIEVLNEKLVYSVTDSQVILPEETEDLMIEGGEDMISLVTCTPIYTNTHRLIVNASRIAYTDEKVPHDLTKSKLPSWHYIFFSMSIPLIGLGLLIYYIFDLIRTKKERKMRNEKNTYNHSIT